MMCDAPSSVKDQFRDIFTKHRPYNALAFSEFMSVVMSTKNMLTRFSKGTLSCNEGMLVNNIVILSNTIGKDTTLIFETPAIVETHYSVVRAILHHLGLPYSAGPLDETMKRILFELDYEMRRQYV